MLSLKTAILLSFISSTYQGLIWEKIGLIGGPVTPLDRRRNAAIGYSSVNNAIFIYGGASEENEKPLNDLLMFNMDSKTWSPRLSSPPLQARFNMVFGSRGNYMYISAGEGIDTITNTKTYFNDLWRFDFTAKTWKELEANMAPKKRFSAGGGIHEKNSNFFLTHGFNDEESLSDLYTYDTDKENGWEKEFAGTNSYDPRYPHARYQHSSTVISDNKLLLFGGCLSGGGTGGPCPSDDSWIFDVSSKEWSEMNRCSSPKSSSAMALLPKGNSTKTRVVLWGGTADTRTTLVADKDDNDEIAVFNGEDEEWKMKKVAAVSNSFPQAREGHVMVTTKDGIVMFGGKSLSDGLFLSDLWLLKGTSEDADACPDGRECGRQYFNLIMLHGVFMFIGWSVFMMMGVFTARYFTFLHPLWFKIHVVFQILGVFFVLSGTVCGIVSVPSHQHFKFAHSIFGYIIFVLVVQQPFNAILRPQPVEQGYNCGRSCWEMWHKWSGRVAMLSSFINITLGLFLAVPPTLVWALWLAYFGLWIIIFIIAEVTKKPFKKSLKRRAKKPVVYDSTNPYRIGKGQANTAF